MIILTILITASMIVIVITILLIFIGVEYNWDIVLFSAPVADAIFLSPSSLLFLNFLVIIVHSKFNKVSS